MNNRVIWILLAAGLSMIPTSAFAQRTLNTTARLNLRAGPHRSSPVVRVLPRLAELTWNGTVAESEGMLEVVPIDTPGHAGWVAGEYLVERQLEAGWHAAACGVLRWPVKTMSDADAASVDRTPKAATLATLRAFPAPKVRPQNARANTIEKTEFGVTGDVIKWGLEPDSDLHLVLATPGNASQTIVLEVPDSSCVTGATAAVRDSIARAREDVIGALGPPPIGITALNTPVHVTVTGVGFFDFGHSTGHPPNAFELHPVLSIHFGS